MSKLFHTSRQTIRENANFIVLFKQDLKDINHVYNDNDMLKDEFRNLCKEAWKKPHIFVVIDLTSDISNGKYSKGLDEFYISV